MREKIISIAEVKNLNLRETRPDDYNKCDGFRITTDQQEILLLIDNYHACCENWGYFMSEDDVDRFIGADLLDIKLTDDALNAAFMERNGLSRYKTDDAFDGHEAGEWDVYNGGIMFVTLETFEGPLQFVAYNAHNGYYGHEAMVISRQLGEKRCL